MQPEILTEQRADLASGARGSPKRCGDRLRDRDRAGVGQRAVVEAGAGDDVGDRGRHWRWRAPSDQARRRQSGTVVQRHMRQDQVLLMADADLVEGELLGEVGDGLHLLAGGVARDAADRLQRDRQRGVAGHPVRVEVLRDPAGKAGSAAFAASRARSSPAAAASAAGRNRPRCGDLLGRHGVEEPPFETRELLLDVGESSSAGLVDEDLDARLVLVVAPAVAVVDAHDRFEIGEQVSPGQELADEPCRSSACGRGRRRR
jgi:hypothetical protein